MRELSQSTSVGLDGIYSELPSLPVRISLENSGNFSEETINMALMLLRRRPPAAGHIAKNLLHAWIGGDLSRLEVELDRTTASPLDEPDDDEMERLQLVKCIAARMKDCPNMFASRSTDPGLDSCVDLLAHLACQGAYTGWQRSRVRTRDAI
jgi:hypothetical protein